VALQWDRRGLRGTRLYTDKDQHDAFGHLVGHSAEGFPVYSYTDQHSKLTSYVVVLPDGRSFSSNEAGQILSSPSGRIDSEVTGAIVTGTLGALAGGPVGGIIGAIAGAFLAGKLKKQVA
jgi:photosystem II stability/assembly factor-like uncharacterized protein